MINAPIVIIVEAKKEDIIAGLGQCVAQMLTAPLFNAQEGNTIPIIYGTVTSGNIWQLLKLKQDIIAIDKVEYYTYQTGKILGILVHTLTQNNGRSSHP